MTSTPIRVLFCGSFQHYSTTVLQALLHSTAIKIVGVVTTPPRPAGRQQLLTKTDVHQFAENQGLPVFYPDNLHQEQVLQDIETQLGHKPEVLFTAGYGKLLPASWLDFPLLGAVNLHFSLLPKYRGANPAEWALLLGETETGVTWIEMNPEFDAGTIIAAAPSPITPVDTRETIYDKLYSLGGELSADVLTTYSEFMTSGTPKTSAADSALKLHLPPKPQPGLVGPYAKKLERPDGFVAWAAVIAAIKGHLSSPNHVSPTLQVILKHLNTQVNSFFLERAHRALAGFPGLWTMIPTANGEKRLKILTCHLEQQRLVLDQVQVEGKSATKWSDIKHQVQE